MTTDDDKITIYSLDFVKVKGKIYFLRYDQMRQFRTDDEIVKEILERVKTDTDSEPQGQYVVPVCPNCGILSAVIGQDEKGKYIQCLKCKEKFYHGEEDIDRF